MSSLNKVMLIGNVGKDPTIRTMNNGDKVASFSIATSERWTDKSSGEKKEKTDWHNVVAFNENIVRVVEQYVKKGTRLYVEGQLQTRKWSDQSGIERYTTEIIIQRFRGEIKLLGGKDDGGGDDGAAPQGGGRAASKSAQKPAPDDFHDDDIPF